MAKELYLIEFSILNQSRTCLGADNTMLQVKRNRGRYLRNERSVEISRVIGKRSTSSETNKVRDELPQ
jgi:hypothetical protein